MPEPEGMAGAAGVERKAELASAVAEDIARFLLPLAIAFAFGALVLLLIGANPVSVYGLMGYEAFGSAKRIAATLSAATPLLFTGIATAICFRSGVFNVGVDGAFVVGGFAAATIAVSVPPTLGWAIIPIAIGGAMIVSAAWLWLPGVLLAKLDVDEVVSTLMLNFIAAGITGFLVNAVFLSETSGNNTTQTVPEAAQLVRLIPPSTLHAGFLIALACLAAYFVWCRWTPSGFEAMLVGINRRFARATGIPIAGTVILVMLVSGVLSGLGGASHALGQVFKFSDGFSAGYGFTGMAVALLARNSPVGILFGAILFGALASAGTTVQLFSDIPLDIVNAIQGAVMIFAVIEFGRLHFLRRRSRA
jgi:ABC-type uncharacterized transport system permease subunit